MIEITEIAQHITTKRHAADTGILLTIKSIDAESLDGGFAGVSLLEQSLYMKNQLLRDADWASMAHSVEIRVPYVDVRLQRSLGVGPRSKKELAAVAGRELPQALSRRSKTGFMTPLAQWRPGSESHWEWSRDWARSWAREVQCAFSL